MRSLVLVYDAASYKDDEYDADVADDADGDGHDTGDANDGGGDGDDAGGGGGAAAEFTMGIIMMMMTTVMMIVVTKAVGRGGCLFLKGCPAAAHRAQQKQRKDWIFPFPIFLYFSTGLF